MEVLSAYKEHRSLAYGIDWCRQPRSTVTLSDGIDCGDGCAGHAEQTNNSGAMLLASCSFYDKSLHLWEVTLQRNKPTD